METLVVSVAVAAIFSVIYTNIVPVLGDYERTENYDDLDTKYAAHWMRMLIIKQGKDSLRSDMSKITSTNPLKMEVDKTAKLEDLDYEEKRYSPIVGQCAKYFTDSDTCINFFKELNITKLYIVPYNIEGFKTYVKNNLGKNPGFQEYVASLSKFNKNSEKQNYYRIIVEMERNNNLKETEDYFTTYATVELNRGVDSVLQSR